MRISVIVPPIEDFYFTRHRFSALGVKVVSSILSCEGIFVDFYNFPLLRKKGTNLSIPPELSHLKKFIIDNETGKSSFFTHYQHFGPPTNECAKIVCEKRPDMCFISCFAYCYANQAIDLAENIKVIYPDITILMGGAGVSVAPLFFMNKEFIDFAIVGEAEPSITRFIKEFKSARPVYKSVPNLYWRDGNKINPPLRYRFTKSKDIDFIWNKTLQTKRSIYISTSITRGCPRNCRFCSIGLSHGTDFRTVSVENIKKSILFVYINKNLPDLINNFDFINKYVNINKHIASKRICFNFEDDNLLLEPVYLLEVMSIIKGYWADVSFYAENGIDYRLLTPELIDDLINAGMRQFNFSLASTDTRTLISQKRESDLSLYEKVINQISKHSVPVITYFICGFREDTKDTIAQNLAYLAKKQTLVGISLFYAVPGLPDFNDYFYISSFSPRLFAGSSAYPWTGSLSTETLITAFRLSRFVNLIKKHRRTEIEENLFKTILRTKSVHTVIKESQKMRIIEVPYMDKELVCLFFKKLMT